LFGLGGDDDDDDSPIAADAAADASNGSGPFDDPGDSASSDGEDVTSLADASDGADASVTPDAGADAATFPGRLAFVTNAKAAGDLASGATLAQLEALCKKAADDAGWPAAWTYTPLLYFTGSPPSARLSKGAAWHRRDGVKVADGDPKLLVALLQPITSSAAGVTPPATDRVWTGAPGAGGAGGALNCAEWTTTAGKAVAGDLSSAATAFDTGSDLSCALEAHVYCFQK
jgi:hypothetical protein